MLISHRIGLLVCLAMLVTAAACDQHASSISPLEKNQSFTSNQANGRSTKEPVLPQHSYFALVTPAGTFSYPSSAYVDRAPLDGVENITIHGRGFEVAWDRSKIQRFYVMKDGKFLEDLQLDSLPIRSGNLSSTGTTPDGGGGPQCDPNADEDQGCTPAQYVQWDNAGCYYDASCSPTYGSFGIQVWPDSSVCLVNFSDQYIDCGFPSLIWTAYTNYNLFVRGSHTTGMFSVTCNGPSLAGYLVMEYKDPYWGFKGYYFGLGTYTPGVQNTYQNPGNIYSMFKQEGTNIPPPSAPPNQISFFSEWYQNGALPWWAKWLGYCNFTG